MLRKAEKLLIMLTTDFKSEKVLSMKCTIFRKTIFVTMWSFAAQFKVHSNAQKYPFKYSLILTLTLSQIKISLIISLIVKLIPLFCKNKTQCESVNLSWKKIWNQSLIVFIIIILCYYNLFEKKHHGPQIS